jgi:hypothetical protein
MCKLVIVLAVLAAVTMSINFANAQRMCVTQCNPQGTFCTTICS